ncbi:hypothetical protein GJAV_G00056980 [Gymnothorax javanicus]|nr:hypothetical protein GJAV_G00056980 [Gymnothorax javanicus]
MPKQDEDLENFLKNVDEISTLVREMNSSNESRQKKAIEDSDLLLASWTEKEPLRTRLNRTVINTKSSQQETAPTDLKNDSEMSSENFMRILEKDAESRAERRRKNEALANDLELKARGNEAYACGDYETAVLCYTEGLQKLRDMSVLYTNRAQAYIKLLKYEEAISDCDWALRCDEKCIKALIHMGRANQALKKYTEARGCYQRILDIEPDRAALVKYYVTQVDLEEKKDVQEKGARDEFEMGKEEAVSVHLLLEKLKKPEQIPMYYCGGLELLSRAITDCTGQTLFRLNDGFSVVSGNGSVRRCLCSTGAFSEELSVSVLKLWIAVCRGNEENQRFLLQSTVEKDCMVQLLASESAGVRNQCLTLLSLFMQDEYGCRLLIGQLDLQRLVKNLMNCLSDEDSSTEHVLSLLGTLAAEEQFRILLREDFTQLFVPPFVKYLRNITSANRNRLPSLISVLFSMTADRMICGEIAQSKECWEAFIIAMDCCLHCEYKEELGALLELMIKLSVGPSPAVPDLAGSIARRCIALLSHPDGRIITRSAGVLSMVLPQSHDATHDAVKGGIVKKILKLLKVSGQTTTRYCIKTLAVCTATSQQAREELLKLDKRLRNVRGLLAGVGEVEAGNAALCLGHCVDVPGAAAALLGTSVVLQLLRLAAGNTGNAENTGNIGNSRKSGRGGSAQQNAAVTLGKLCKADLRHRVELRELHGLEILHSCLQQEAS